MTSADYSEARIHKLRTDIKDLDWAVKKYAALLLELELAEIAARNRINREAE